MIKNVAEYLKITNNESLHYRLKEPANDDIWIELIKNYPEVHSFIVFNKTLSPDVLLFLAQNSDENIRWQIACKRKINYETFVLLARDTDPSVRERIALNPKTPSSILSILADDNFVSEKIKGLDNESIADIAKRRLKNI